MSRIPPSLTALLLAAAAYHPLGAQAVPLSEAPTCAGCGLTFEPVAVLGDLDDPASPGPTATAARLTDGRIAVTSPTMGPQVLIYEADGTFVRTIGREGEGPGELMAAPFVRALDAEEIALFDPGQGVIHRVEAEGAHLGTTPVRMRGMAFAPHPAGWVVSGMQPSAGEMRSLHLVDPSGELLASMAATEEENPRRIIRQMAVAPDGSIWAAQVNGGAFEHWSPDGELLAEYLIENEDLQREAPQRMDFTTQVPPATVSDVSIDGEGRVWIWLVVPDADFEPGPMQGPPVVEEIFDTRVLVFDPGTRGVELRDQFDVLLRPLGDGWAYEVVETEIGDRKVRVGRVSATGPEPGT